MAVSSKIKALLNITGKDHAGLAAYLGISKQALSNKLYRDSFSAEDLIKVAAFLECELAFVVNGGQKITLTQNDLNKE